MEYNEAEARKTQPRRHCKYTRHGMYVPRGFADINKALCVLRHRRRPSIHTPQQTVFSVVPRPGLSALRNPGNP